MATFFMGETAVDASSMTADQLRAKIGELGFKATNLQIQIDQLEAQIKNPPGGFFNLATANTRLAALKDQQNSVMTEAQPYIDRLKVLTGKDLTADDIALAKQSAWNAEWMRQAKVYNLTDKQIADVIKHKGKQTSRGISTKTLLIGGAAALVVGYFMFK